MPPSTKTYWRIPGETGLPTELDFSGSKGVGSHQVLWPYPVRQDDKGYLDYVYPGHTLLPIELDVTDPKGTIALSATLGVCSEICIPAQAMFDMPIDGQMDAANDLRIRQALSNVPVAWDQGADPIGSVSITPDGKALAVTVTNPSVEVDSLIAVTEDGEPLFGVPQKSPEGDLVILPIVDKSEDSKLAGATVELTFLSDSGAYTVERTMPSGEPDTGHTP